MTLFDDIAPGEMYPLKNVRIGAHIKVPKARLFMVVVNRDTDALDMDEADELEYRKALLKALKAMPFEAHVIAATYGETVPAALAERVPTIVRKNIGSRRVNYYVESGDGVYLALHAWSWVDQVRSLYESRRSIMHMNKKGKAELFAANKISGNAEAWRVFTDTPRQLVALQWYDHWFASLMQNNVITLAQFEAYKADVGNAVMGKYFKNSSGEPIERGSMKDPYEYIRIVEPREDGSAQISLMPRKIGLSPKAKAAAAKQQLGLPKGAVAPKTVPAKLAKAVATPTKSIDSHSGSESDDSEVVILTPSTPKAKAQKRASPANSPSAAAAMAAKKKRLSAAAKPAIVVTAPPPQASEQAVDSESAIVAAERDAAAVQAAVEKAHEAIEGAVRAADLAARTTEELRGAESHYSAQREIEQSLMVRVAELRAEAAAAVERAESAESALELHRTTALARADADLTDKMMADKRAAVERRDAHVLSDQLARQLIDLRERAAQSEGRAQQERAAAAAAVLERAEQAAAEADKEARLATVRAAQAKQALSEAMRAVEQLNKVVEQQQPVAAAAAQQQQAESVADDAASLDAEDEGSFSDTVLRFGGAEISAGMSLDMQNALLFDELFNVDGAEAQKKSQQQEVNSLEVDIELGGVLAIYAPEHLRTEMPQLFCQIQPRLRIEYVDLEPLTVARITGSFAEAVAFGRLVAAHMSNMLQPTADLLSGRGEPLLLDTFERDAFIYASMLVSNKSHQEVLAACPSLSLGDSSSSTSVRSSVSEPADDMFIGSPGFFFDVAEQAY